MNRNVESHFATLPSAQIERSTFDRSFSHKTSFNIGEVIPFYLDMYMPGDTFSVDTSVVARMQTLLTPVMDNIYCETFYFSIPWYILWTHTHEFFGENTQSAWAQQNTYLMPQLAIPSGGFNVGTIADYLGVPTGVGPNSGKTLHINALPFRAYAMICDQWFRDQNLTDPLVINTGDSTVNGSNGSNYRTDVALGGKPFLAAKYHDEFTSCLPAPQKRTQPVGIFGLDTFAPVMARNGATENNFIASDNTSAAYPIMFRHTKDYNATPSGSNAQALSSATGYTDGTAAILKGSASLTTQNLYPINLFASMYGVGTINELRLAFQLQKYFEKEARAGSRYREIISEMFNVQSPDQRMMIPEYLGGHRFPLSIHQVANTSEGTNSNLGDLGAMSNTSDINSDFTKSFTCHGFVMGVMVCRYEHSYSQGLEPLWTIGDKFSLYWPVFANIGEQPVRKDSIYMTGDPVVNEQAFGYQEAWYSYRYKKNQVSGEMRPGISNSLASWHLGDYYTQMPTLSDSWIREDKANVDRALAVTSAVSNQIFADIYVSNRCTRPMPMYSIPGLIDHH